MSRPTLSTINVTHFFNRETMLHAFGDVTLRKPVPLKQGMITVVLTILFAGLFYLLGILSFTPVTIFFIVGPAFAIGKYAPMSIWNGRTLVGFLKINSKFLLNNKIYVDHKGLMRKPKARFVFAPIWISRREEYKKLAELKKNEASS